MTDFRTRLRASDNLVATTLGDYIFLADLFSFRDFHAPFFLNKNKINLENSYGNGIIRCRFKTSYNSHAKRQIVTVVVSVSTFIVNFSATFIARSPRIQSSCQSRTHARYSSEGVLCLVLRCFARRASTSASNTRTTR